MKRLLQWMIAATLIISGMSVLTACGSDDDNGNNPPVQPDDGGNSGYTAGDITFVKRSWDGEKVVDKEVTEWACWLNEIEIEKNKLDYRNAYWYVTGYHNIEGGIVVPDGLELNLILCDDATLTLQYILVEGASTLRIFGQKRGTGQLMITDPGDHCAIGTFNKGGGTIEIHGGKITAKGGSQNAAIGEGCGSDYINLETYYFNDIKIYGGVINAAGGDGAAAIGGNLFSDGHGNVSIYGGDISAQGGGYVTWLRYWWRMLWPHCKREYLWRKYQCQGWQRSSWYWLR